MADIDNQIVSNSYLSSNPDFNVESTMVDGKQIQHATLTSCLTFRQDDASATVSYFGFAKAGSAEGSAVWRIMRLTTTNPTNLKYADGNAKFDNIWTNRASLTYS